MDTEALHRQYGSVYITRLPDGFVVPWKPLSIQSYIDYTLQQLNGLASSSELENRIFRECVQDKTIIQQMDFQKAGTIATVVHNIWEHSGPNTVDTFQLDLSSARELINSPITRSIHELVKIITMAYPYKPEEIYEMDYKTLMIRAAMAEDKLLALGVITAPINISPVEEKKKEKPKREVLDAKKLWEIQEGLLEKDKKAKVKDQVEFSQDGHRVRKKVPWKKSPVLEQPSTHKIDFRQARGMDELGMTGAERMEIHVDRAKMVEDAQLIYADLIKELEKKKAEGG